MYFCVYNLVGHKPENQLGEDAKEIEGKQTETSIDIYNEEFALCSNTKQR